MISALHLILSPFRAWEKVTTARRGVVAILCVYLLPLMLAGVSIESYSLMRFGERRGELSHSVKLPIDTVVRYAAAQSVFLLVSIMGGAQLLQWVAHSFQVQSSYLQCFTLMAYGFGPILLSRYLDALPAMNTWACWGLGALFCFSVLYHGVALALKPEQTKGFGLYLVSVILVALSSLLSHAVALAVLHGKLLA